MRPPRRAWPRARNVRPAAVGEEAVITAGDQLGAVLQRDPEPGLDGLPVREHGGAHVAPAAAAADCAVDPVTGPQVSDGPGASVGHQHRRLPAHAVPARMTAAPVGVDGPAERDAGRLGHPVEDAPGVYLEEGHAAERGGVEGAGHRAPLEQGGGRAGATWPRPDPHVIPAHDRHYRTGIRIRQKPVRSAGPGGPGPRRLVPGPAAPGRGRPGRAPVPSSAKRGAATGFEANDLAVGDSKRKFPAARRR